MAAPVFDRMYSEDIFQNQIEQRQQHMSADSNYLQQLQQIN